jgi:transposase-like protein
MRRKRCPKCCGQNVKKYGKRNSRQRYKCNKCNHIFSVKSGRKKGQSFKLWEDYADRNQTLLLLAERNKTSISTIRRRLEKTNIRTKKNYPYSSINNSGIRYCLLGKKLWTNGI